MGEKPSITRHRGVFREKLLPKAPTSEDVLPPPPSPPELVAAVFQEEPSFEVEESPQERKEISLDEDNESDDESIDMIDINPNVKFLPVTVDGLADRFSQLFKEFMRQGKHEQRNELVFLLDVLLRQDGINRYEYTRLNNMLAESLESETEIESTKDEAAESTTMEDEEVEGKLRKLIRSTTDYLIQPEKRSRPN